MMIVTQLARRFRPAAVRGTQLLGPQRQTIPIVGRKAGFVAVIFSNGRFGFLGRLTSIYGRFFLADVTATSGRFIADAGFAIRLYCIG